MRIGPVLLVLACILPVGADPRSIPPPLWSEYERALDALDRTTPTVRDLSTGALASLQLAHPGEQAQSLLAQAFAAQDIDPASAGFGTVPWRIGHPEIQDPNSIEFSCQPLGVIFEHYRGQLAPAFIETSMPHLRAAITAIERHHVSMAYTNIFLMKSMNLVELGEVVQDADATRQGYQNLSEWLKFSAASGITEYDSPTYYAAALDSLVVGALYAQSAAGRADFRSALDLFWRDISSNYFPGDQSLSGPHSRDYDFLTGRGGLELFLALEGLRSVESTQRPTLDFCFMAENQLSPSGYHPDVSQARRPVKLVRSTFDTDTEAGNGRDRTNYVTEHYAIGSASHDYGPQDKSFAINLAGDGPAITLLPDEIDTSYGLRKDPDHSGHLKPHHIRLDPVMVQRSGTVLVTLDLNASDMGETSSFATHVILPAAAHPTFDSANGILALRYGGANVVCRILQVDGTQHQKATVSLQSNARGLAQGAMSLALVHYQGPRSKLGDHHVKVALLFAVDDGSDLQSLVRTVAAATFSQHYTRPLWTVQAAGLAVSRDLEAHRILSRTVDGQPVSLP